MISYHIQTQNDKTPEYLKTCFYDPTHEDAENTTPKDAENSTSKSIPVYPYVLAVGGTRKTNGIDLELLKKKIENQLRVLLDQWRTCSGPIAPFVILTGLSSGSDRLFAEVALKLREKEKYNIRLFGVLAMPKDVLRTLENTVGSPDEFDGWCKKMDAIVEIQWETEVQSLLEKLDAVEKNGALKEQFMAYLKLKGWPEHEKSPFVPEMSDWLKYFSTLLGFFNNAEDGKDAEKLEKFQALLAFLEFRQFREFRRFVCQSAHTLMVFENSHSKQSAKELQGTPALIRYKLYGDYPNAENDPLPPTFAKKGNEAAIPELDRNPLSFLAIGPVVKFSFRNAKTWWRRKPAKKCDTLIIHRDFQKKNGTRTVRVPSRIFRVPWWGNITFDKEISSVISTIGKINCAMVKHENEVRNTNTNVKTENTDTNRKAKKVKKSKEDKKNQNESHRELRYFNNVYDFQKKSLNRSAKPRNETPSLGETESVTDSSLLKNPYFKDADLWNYINHFNFADRLAVYFKSKMQRLIGCYCICFCLIPIFGFMYVSSQAVAERNQEATLVRILLDSHAFTGWTPEMGMQVFSALGLLSVTLATLFFFAWAHSHDYHQTYHNIRAVAEGLRVQIFWRIAGINESVPNHYTSHQIPETSWLRVTITSLNFCMNPVAPKRNMLKCYNFVYQAWICSRMQYLLGEEENDEEADVKETENGKKENCCLKFFRRCWVYWMPPKKSKFQIGAIRWRELKSNRKMEACYLPCFMFLGLIWYGTRYFLHDAGILVQESIKPGSSTAQIASFPDWGWVIMLAAVAFVSIGTTRIIYRRLMLYALEERKLFQETSPFRRASLMISQSLPPVQNTEEKTETTDEITNESDTNES